MYSEREEERERNRLELDVEHSVPSTMYRSVLGIVVVGACVHIALLNRQNELLQI